MNLDKLIAEAREKENILTGGYIARMLEENNWSINDVCIVQRMDENGYRMSLELKREVDKLPVRPFPPED